ncbi:hypothetical protein LCGC14_2435120, partial [marine sediment metagenome]
MADVTFYPDAHIESTSVDGHAYYFKSTTPLTWADLLTATANKSSDDGTNISIIIGASSTTNRWYWLQRIILLFDTSGLPDGCDITSAVLSVYGQDKDDIPGWEPNMNVYRSFPNSNIAIQNADFNRLDDVPYSNTPVTYDGFSTAGYNNFILNTAGLANISKTGITKLGLRNTNYDVAGVAPTWISGNGSKLGIWTAEKGGDFRPKLVVTYTTVLPTVATGPATDILDTSATLNGNITDLGIPTATQHGHCWNTTGTPTTADSKTEEGVPGATGAFTSAMTGLTPGVKYYVRAYAINDDGTVYGNQVVFWADRGTVFPTDPLLRVSGLRRTFWSGLGGQAVYQMELALGGMSITYVSPIGDRDIPSAVTPLTTAASTFTPSGEGYRLRDYGVWLSGTTVDIQTRLFGHSPPTYTEWVDWMEAVS